MTEEENLNQILNDLNNTPTSELIKQPQMLQVLFQALWFPDHLTAMTAKTTVNNIISRDDSGALVQSGALLPFFAKGLQEEEPAQVVSFTLHQINRFLSKKDGILQWFIQNDTEHTLIVPMVSLLLHEELSVSDEATKSVIILSSHESGLAIVFELLQGMLTKELLVKDSTIWFRLLASVVDIAVSSIDTFNAFERSPFSSMVFDLFKDMDDFLLQLNGFELLSKIATVRPGLKSLYNHEFLKLIIELFEISKIDPLKEMLLIPGIFKLITHIWNASYHLDDYCVFFGTNNNHILTRKLLHFIDEYASVDYTRTQDTTSLDASILCLSEMACTRIGLLFLSGNIPVDKNMNESNDKHKNISLILGRLFFQHHIGLHACARALLPLAEQSSSSNIDKKTVNSSICSENSLLQSINNNNVNVTKLQQALFYQIGISENINSMDRLMQGVVMPFEETICGILDIFLSLSKHSWAISLMCSHHSFVEYILDRKMSPSALVTQWKYKVITTIASNTQVDPAAVDQFKQYAAAGAFYVPYESQVKDPEMNVG